jgi:hypothetical protein
MAALTGWLAVSCQYVVNEKNPFEPWLGYSRQKVSWTGSPDVDYAPGLTGHPWTGSYRPVWTGAAVVRWFGVYDAEVAGYCQVYFAAWDKSLEPPTYIPLMDLSILFNLDVLLAINATAMNANVSAICEPARGTVLGTINCAPLIAGVGLSIVCGQIVRRGAAAKLLEAAE